MDAPDRSSLPRHASSPQRAALPDSVDATAALDPIFSEVLERGLTALALPLDDMARDAIAAHVRLLLAWNEHINLSGLRTPEEVARGHVLDALLAVAPLRDICRERPSLLDLGSGGGFPGVPLAVALPARRAALVDSIGKKAAFLRVAAAAVADVVQVDVMAERAEDLAEQPDQREAWDIVTARAIGSVAQVAELGLPLVRIGGHVVAWKSAGPAGQDGKVESEISDADRIIRSLGGESARVVELPLADDVGLPGHCLVVIEKVRSTPDGYPRGAGERRRRPLG
ncbi:MAG: rRNA (guanine527-N7)-methyltransferase [Chloroflexota bacterium]|jgi:16S rRNA (guanine527-N7)-methyltransferase|nr:rRNA (guanine527-N7)-methyltransferase [Chloroflexota bacterium]